MGDHIILRDSGFVGSYDDNIDSPISDVVSISSHSSSSSLKYQYSVNSVSEIDNYSHHEVDDHRTTSNKCVNNKSPQSYVQRMAQRFETLSRNNDNCVKSCNWWLNNSNKKDENINQQVIKKKYLSNGCECLEPIIENDTASFTQPQWHDSSTNTNTKTEFATIIDKKSAPDNSNKLSIANNNRPDKIRNEEILSDFEEEIDRAVTVVEIKNDHIYAVIIDDDDNDNDETINSDSFDSDSEPEEMHMSTLEVPIRADSTRLSGCLQNIVEELLKTEREYINSLKQGIDNYVSVFKEKVPPTLLGQQYVIFGNIRRIYDLHKDELLPSLEGCNEDVQQIGGVFCKFIQEDYFYCYVLYAMNRTKSEVVCKNNVDFFKRRQEEVGDRLGMNSFLVKPIQRLPKYQLLFNQMIKELSKSLDIEETKLQIASCCKAEKNLQRMLDCVNESMSINDIEDCHEINILHQGKFKKMNEFEIYDWEVRRKYKGKLFIFERCIVYTEYSRSRLIYRGHYLPHKIGIQTDKTNKKLSLFSERKGNQSVEFFSDTNTINDWRGLVENMMIKFAEHEKNKIARRKGKRQVYISVTPEIRSSTRGSVISVDSITSSGSNTSSSERSSSSSRDSFEVGSMTTWDERKNVEKLIHSEKNYIRLLSSYRKLYLNLAEEDEFKIAKFLELFNDILDFHKNIFYPELVACGISINSICDIFKKHLSNGSFNNHLEYGVWVKDTRAILEEINENIPNQENLLSINNFLLLPIKRPSDYQATFNAFIEDFFDKNVDTMTSAFKLSAVVEVELNNLSRKVEENYKLNNMKDSTINIRPLGLVQHSDIVTLDALNVLNHRLLILTKALICVRIKQKKGEKFIGVFFHIPHTMVSIRMSKTNPHRAKFTHKSNQTTYSVIFQTNEKKNLFCRRLQKATEM